MFVIITEDSGSGFQFWSNLVQYLDIKGSIISQPGNKKVISYVRSILGVELNSDWKLLQEADYIFLAIDRASVSIAGQYSELVKDLSAMLGKVFCLDILSFEEILLSYERLSSYVRISKELSHLRDLLLRRNGSIFTRDFLLDVTRVLNRTIGKPNLERCLSALYQEITRGTCFFTGKSQLGTFWTEDCICHEKLSYCGDNEFLLPAKYESILKESVLAYCILDNGRALGLSEYLLGKTQHTKTTPAAISPDAGIRD